MIPSLGIKIWGIEFTTEDHGERFPFRSLEILNKLSVLQKEIQHIGREKLTWRIDYRRKIWLAAFAFPLGSSFFTTSWLTGTMSDAHPTPTPEKNLPAWSKPGTVPKPIMSQPAENGKAVSMRAILRPKKSIIHPPRGPPSMAPILRRDWWGKRTNRINERCMHFLCIFFRTDVPRNLCMMSVMCSARHTHQWLIKFILNRLFYCILFPSICNKISYQNLSLTFCTNVVSVEHTAVLLFFWLVLTFKEIKIF